MVLRKVSTDGSVSSFVIPRSVATRGCAGRRRGERDGRVLGLLRACEQWCCGEAGLSAVRGWGSCARTGGGVRGRKAGAGRWAQAHPLPEEREEDERLEKVANRPPAAAVVLYLAPDDHPGLVP